MKSLTDLSVFQCLKVQFFTWTNINDQVKYGDPERKHKILSMDHKDQVSHKEVSNRLHRCQEHDFNGKELAELTKLPIFKLLILTPLTRAITMLSLVLLMPTFIIRFRQVPMLLHLEQEQKTNISKQMRGQITDISEV